MKIDRVWAVYFSPNGNTEKIIVAVADSLGKKLDAEVKRLDYTLPSVRNEINSFSKSDLVIWGTPVYAGRIPNKILPYIQNNFIGNDAMAVPIAVFGNRSYDDALIELRNVLESNGFHTIAGAGFAAKHAFSKVLSAGRPDKDDMDKAEVFSKGIADKVNMLNDIPKPISVKGNNPPTEYYKPKGLDGKPTVFLKAKPKTDHEKCNKCGICISSCPMGSINIEDSSEVTGICIKCHACVNKCPNNAKYFDDEAFLSHKMMLERDFMQRKEPEIFL
ncbi:EFR1 family ferrodoxin [Anaerovorax odorimutans]|uniref:EFR1 family ferrodoxin n=1 Tax=Anaerovorax odorimutans TaxID=109327 RepID=UPI0003F83B2E|nr:EFR1 family ferrodoxin [Anaerovorax odorimutans]